MKLQWLVLSSAVVKLLSAFMTFFMTLVVTRNLDIEQSGMFMFAIAIISVTVIFFRLGLDNVVLRIISAKLGKENSQAVLYVGITWIAAVSLPVVACIFLCSDNIAIHLLSKPEFAPVLKIAIWTVPVMAVFMLIAVGFQAFHRVIVTTLFQNLGVSSLFIVGFGTLCFLNIGDLSAVNAIKVYLASAIIILIVAILMWHLQIKGDWGKLKLIDKDLWQASSNLWTASTMSLTVQWSGVLIAGALVSSSEVAHLTAAQRTAMLTSFVLMVVNMVVAPRYALLWKENKISEVHRLAKWSTRGMIILVLPIIAIMLLFPDFIMGLFGDEFVVAGDLLAIMAVGQFINVATGSVGYLLNMSGHERDFRKVTMFAGPLTIILSYVFIVQWGVTGAAVATAVGLSLQNIGALFMVRKRLGFWPIG